MKKKSFLGGKRLLFHIKNVLEILLGKVFILSALSDTYNISF